MTRTSQTTTGTQAQRGMVPQLQTQMQTLQTQFREFQELILGGGGGSSRQGTAGGVKVGRATTGAVARSPAGNAAGATGGSNTEWVTNLLRQHGAGLTPPEIKQMAITAGRSIGKSYPYDSLRTLERNGTIRNQGGKYRLVTAGGTGPVARSGTSRTRTRAKRAAARAMTAVG